MSNYEIQHKETGLCMFMAHASDEDSALNEYAGWRPGYDTFHEMCISQTFRPFTNVHAFRATYQR